MTASDKILIVNEMCVLVCVCMVFFMPLPFSVGGGGGGGAGGGGVIVSPLSIHPSVPYVTKMVSVRYLLKRLYNYKI